MGKLTLGTLSFRVSLKYKSHKTSKLIMNRKNKILLDETAAIRYIKFDIKIVFSN